MEHPISYLSASALLAVSVLITGCGISGGGLNKPDATLPANYRYASVKNGKRAADNSRWWRAFGDSGLNSLMAQVRLGNRDLRGGMNRVQQARALVGSARSGRLPQLSLSPSASRDRTPDQVNRGSASRNIAAYTSNNFALPVSVDWELDLFGRIRRGEAAARADALAAKEDYLALRLSLESQAASAYFTLRALDLEIGIVRKAVKTRKASLKLANNLEVSGVVSGLDAAQAQALLASSEAGLAALLRQRAAQESAIAVLVGQPASSFRLKPRGLTGRPPSIPTGIPSELARARPDIRRAERRLAAENARVGVAVAAFYPSISLSGRAGVRASDISNLFTKGAQFWGIGPSVYLPIFSGGQRRAELKRSKARYEEVLEDYQQTVLESLAEVEIALASAKYYRSQVSAQSRVVSSSAKARNIAKAQYEGGIVSYLSVLDAERTALNGEREQARLKGAEFINTVQLIRALGGRW